MTARTRLREIVGKSTLGVMLIALLLAIAEPASAAGEEHRNHIGVGAGVGRNDSKNAWLLSFEYERLLNEKWGVIGFWEETFGDFDVSAGGILGAYHPDSHWKIFAGAGIERKLQERKNKALVKIGGAYDWHFDRYSIGPMVAVDFIEGGEQVYYLAIVGGYSF